MQHKLVPEAVKDLVHRVHKKTRSSSTSTNASSRRPSLDADLSTDSYYYISERDLPRHHRNTRNGSVSPRSSCRQSIESATESTTSSASSGGPRGRSAAQVPLATVPLNTSKPLVPPPVPPKDTLILPVELDAEIHVAHRRTLSRSPARSGSPNRRNAIYFQSMQPQYDSASKMLFFHDPSAAALTQL
ncbi:hypothetical protein PHLGIDRAFT_117026 [Phlebiopsis gigantea 11061_1 CR5-6]|uniref:Uncharacterized protein n=1 Tax=Phlebiopsis gigantea (strain 11061_1 CR5-6) TaxID=745531 RepID=A0A0C3NTN5_PHLG1|nr:hypothetical protein PHLGIDRAFT_117026 [Phlebiopsis gigantea 11061_1 CR5-6]